MFYRTNPPADYTAGKQSRSAPKLGLDGQGGPVDDAIAQYEKILRMRPHNSNLIEMSGRPSDEAIFPLHPVPSVATTPLLVSWRQEPNRRVAHSPERPLHILNVSHPRYP